MRDSALPWMRMAMCLVFAVTLLWLASCVGGLVKIIIIAALLAYMLDPMARFLESSGMTRALATGVIFLGIALVTTATALLLLPLVTEEIRAIRDGVSAGRATGMIRSLESTLETRLGFLGLQDLDLVHELQEVSQRAGDRLFGVFRDAVPILANLLLIPFIMFFLLKDWHDFVKRCIGLVPNRYFEFALSLIHKTDRQLGGYIRGQFMDSAIVGLLALVSLCALDVKYFVLLGVLMGISNLVPFIGPIVGAIPPILIALIESGDLTKPLYVALAMAGIQVIDNALIKPLVVAKMVRLHPVVVLLAVIIGGKFFGIMGMILSVPLAGIAKLIAEEAALSFRKYGFN